MISRVAVGLATIGAMIAVACVDMSAPKGPASISVLQLPAPFVVRGAVMGDSLGNPAAPGPAGTATYQPPVEKLRRVWLSVDGTRPGQIGRAHV